jgi:hypothetical protein
MSYMSGDSASRSRRATAQQLSIAKKRADKFGHKKRAGAGCDCRNGLLAERIALQCSAINDAAR